RDDEVRNVVYRIHDKNSLKIRRARYGNQPGAAGKLITGAAAASLALWAAPNLQSTQAAPSDRHEVTQAETRPQVQREPTREKEQLKSTPAKAAKAKPDLVPPQS